MLEQGLGLAFEEIFYYIYSIIIYNDEYALRINFTFFISLE